jgi:hypothetical protein
MKNSTELKICNTFTEEFTEKQTQEVKLIKDLFEGSIDIIPSIIEPVIREDKQKDFKSAYSWIMQTYKPYHNIKPCIANVLVNGLSDGWRVNSPGVAYECLRVFDFDLSKAGELAKLYFENSRKSKRRTLAHLRGALKWVYLHRDFKLKCERLSREIPCIGSKEICYKIRGIHKSNKGGYSNMELAENQKALYLRKFLDYGYFLRLSKRAMNIYFFLLQKYFEFGFDTLFISYRELAKGSKTEYQHIAEYLKELQKVNLIFYTPGKPGLGSKIASEIKVLDITGRKESRAEALFKEVFKN